MTSNAAPELIGRQAEVETVTALARQAAAGGGAAVVVEASLG